MVIFTISLLTLSGCMPSTREEIAIDDQAPGNAPEATTAPQNVTPTPTPTVLVLEASTEEPGLPPLEYSIEIRMPLEMSASKVIAEPGEGSTCIVIMPISIAQEGDRKMSRGSNYIECHYTIPHDPIPYTIHVFNRFNASFDGEVFPPSESYPEGWIDGYLTIDGTNSQYYIDFQQEVPNLCPQSSPCTAPGTRTFNLPFHLANDYHIEQDWTFILHID